LVKAKNPDEAYRKALKIGKSEEQEYLNTEGDSVKFTFEGLTSLLPIYEELEDGSELEWSEFENRSVKKIKSWVKSKQDLEVFSKD